MTYFPTDYHPVQLIFHVTMSLIFENICPVISVLYKFCFCRSPSHRLMLISCHNLHVTAAKLSAKQRHRLLHLVFYC